MLTKVNGYIIGVGNKSIMSKIINHLWKKHGISCSPLEGSLDELIEECELPDGIAESDFVWGYEAEFCSEWDAEAQIEKIEAYLRRKNDIVFFSYSTWVHSDGGGFNRNSREG